MCLSQINSFMGAGKYEDFAEIYAKNPITTPDFAFPVPN
jgi:hypothetical protein